ncbi:MAG: hypothetical protein A2X80_06605 [Geobacteraceae bacterium GWB2_52_12]|nr:MAG: hypothetical protein A2X80_06605 [Geobacteraceae bacterium GWB2_52_12]
MARLDGYVADIEYIHHFCRELGPAWLNFVLAMQGIEPVQLKSGFSSCDLGCGQGLSTNVFASCHPEGQFHGIDFNAAHIQGARGLASQAKLENVTFWEASFDDLGSLDLPEFDFITLHGVYSWVNSDNRNKIVDFIRCKLKVGGVVYVSYNCLPGWSSNAPIRQLLVSCADMTSDDLEEQIDASIAFVGRLKSLDVSYFSNNPSANDFFDALCKLPKEYLAHEYFNEHWIQFYHTDVAKDFAQANMAFVGSASFADNLDFLRFSLAEQQLLNDIQDPVLRETAKDFTVNQQFRRDVFTKGRKRMFPNAHRELVSRCRFELAIPIGKDKLMLHLTPRGANFASELYKLILHVLNEHQRSLDELLQNQHIARFGSDNVLQAVMVLLSSGYILPAVDPSPEAIASARLFNYAMLERTALDNKPLYLASPVVQTGIELDWVERLLLLCELTDSGDPSIFVSSILRECNYALVKDDAVIQSWEENLEELERQIRSFNECLLPLLKRLGVV